MFTHLKLRYQMA